MARRLFQVEGGFSDGVIYMLSGYGQPGGDDSSQDEATIGSVYEDVSNFKKYRKTQEGNGSDKWVHSVSKDNNQSVIDQTAHGFTVNDWVYRNDDGSFKKAKAVDDANTSYEVFGIVDTVYTADSFLVVTSGLSTVSDANPDGSALFLSQTVAGTHTLTKPVEDVVKSLGFIINGVVFVQLDASVKIDPDEPFEVPHVFSSLAAVHNADGVIVDDVSGCQWIVEVDDPLNIKRYVCQVMGVHNGTDGIDASTADFCIGQAIEVPYQSEIEDLAIGVALNGSGAGQTMDLVVSATPQVTVTARRISM